MTEIKSFLIYLSKSSTYATISENEFNELLKNQESRPFLVVFTAEWLGEGTIMDSIIEGLVEDYEGEVGFYRIDIEESKNVSHQLGIRRLPAIFFFKNGEISDHLSGMVPARTLQQHINHIIA